jgi:SAM-dependent methyltransferase
LDESSTHARWAAVVAERARAHWTPERTAQLLGDKRPIIRPAEGAVLLRALGLMRDDGTIPPAQVRKYFQINHIVAFLGPALRALRERHATVQLVDIGCGRSYLTLLLAWCAREVWHHPHSIVGIDRNPMLVAESTRRADAAGLAGAVRFLVGDAADLAPAAVHGVVALHACDTATCDALAYGIARGADVIAVAPCCQAELARGWSRLAERGTAGAFATVWQTPHLRRETAADITDAMRMELVRSAGYEAMAMEFVPAEHTRKNTLLRAIRSGEPDPRAAGAYRALRDATGGVDITLAQRLGCT